MSGDALVCSNYSEDRIGSSDFEFRSYAPPGTLKWKTACDGSRGVASFSFRQQQGVSLFPINAFRLRQKVMRLPSRRSLLVAVQERLHLLLWLQTQAGSVSFQLRNPEKGSLPAQPGAHSYVFVEGVGECRKNFMDMVEGLEKGEVDVVVVAGAKLLYVDTSPMWMEKFISTVKRRGILIADAKQNKEYDLRKPEDEATFRALRKQ